MGKITNECGKCIEYEELIAYLRQQLNEERLLADREIEKHKLEATVAQDEARHYKMLYDEEH